MLAYPVHDVSVIPEKQELPPQDGWRCWALTGKSRLECSCGHAEGPMLNRVAPLMAKLHVLSGA
ncbi:hypothetical protein [Streptomyces sp. WAC 01529]|uniref:hypothetical protein n=1 Tax=Streptomyces sp. WAC 01529 TaxID=2203205 RepID=UPI000F74402E|nr:hypothetical protein [Streptomyces sp. WAC 01529]